MCTHALDALLQFFIAPLCAETSLEREVQAVDSEFAGVIQDDGCRAAQLMCHTVRGSDPTLALVTMHWLPCSWCATQ